MRKQNIKKPDYGNWVSKKLLYGTGILTLIFTGLSFLHSLFLIGAVFFLIAFVYFVYARHKFSPAGGNLQANIRDLVLDYLNWDGHGEALDIGCGNAPLTINIVKKFGKAKAVGIDTWGVGWEYSQKYCEQNAALQ